MRPPQERQMKPWKTLKRRRESDEEAEEEAEKERAEEA